MSQTELYRQKKAKLKTSVGELLGPLLKRFQLAQDPEDPHPWTIIEDIHILVEKLKEHLEDREELETKLIGNLGKIEREIDYWNDYIGEKNYCISSNNKEIYQQTFRELRSQYMHLRNNLGLLGIEAYWVGPHQKASNVPPASMQIEFGESSNSNNQEDDGPIELQQCMNDLQPHLKECLVNLTIFPENIELKKRLLVYWWIGVGIVLSGNENKTDEQLGEEYFSELVEKGYLKPVLRKHNQVVDRCTINPTIHKQLMSSCQWDGTFLKEIVENDGTWHFDRNAILNRGIMYLNSSDINFKMKEIDVVQLGRWHNPKSEEETNSEDHIEADKTDFLRDLGQSVRYLSLRGISGIRELPESIGKLGDLRILDLRSCHNLELLPQKPRSKLRKMVAWIFPQQKKWFDKLTHLDISECYLLDSLPKWICELSNLQVLKGFVAGSSRTRTQFCQLCDLSKLKQLRKLSIKVANKLFTPTDFNGLEPLHKLLVLTIIWSIDHQKDSRGVLSKEKSGVNEDKKSEVEKQSRGNAEDNLNISEGGCEQIPKRDNAVEAEQQNIENTRQSLNIIDVESQQIRGVIGSTISFPKNLDKLDIRCYPNAEAPEWLYAGNLPKLKRLYIRGGELTTIRDDAAWGVEILRLRFLKRVDLDWLKLSSTFPKLKWLEYEKCPRLTNFPRNRSHWFTEQDGAFPNLHGVFNDDKEIVLSPNSSLFNDDDVLVPSPIPELSRGRVGLDVNGKITAPLVECSRELRLDLSSTGFSQDRDGLDLVLVLDVSQSMKGDKFSGLKNDILYLGTRLSPVDRLSIVTFSTIAKRQCRLSQVTESFKTELEVLINSLEADGNTNTFDGLQMGLKVLKDRRFSRNRAVGIILVSGGAQTIRFGDASKVPLDNVPVHTFGFRPSDINQDWRVLKAIADNSIRGRFTDLYAQTNYYYAPLVHSFYELIGQAVNCLTLTITQIEKEATISDVRALSHSRYISESTNDTGSIIVEVGSIYKGYTAFLILDLYYPSTDQEHRAAIFQISYSYEFKGEKLEEEPVTVYAHRMRQVTNKWEPYS